MSKFVAGIAGFMKQEKNFMNRKKISRPGPWAAW